MAKPVERPSAVSVLEDAAHLLRRAPLETLLCHWVGSVPFAVGLLIFWHNVTHIRVSDAACAAESLAVALLLLWMNCWRAVFAGRMHRLLSGAADKPWGRHRIRRLIVNQAFPSAAKTVLLPLALVSIFTFAGAVSFFRNAVVLGDREDLDALSMMSVARRLSRVDRFQCWLIQFLLLLLGTITLLNVAVTFIVLPELIKMLTGMESVFSRSGVAYFANQLFLLCMLGATWLVFDPFVQTVYCLRCFQAESVETGEDLRAGLRRVRAALAKSAVAALVALAILAVPVARVWAADAVGAGDLERGVRHAMEAPEYSWRIPPPTESGNTPWIIRATDRAIAAIQAGIKWIGDTIDKVLRWIFGGLNLGPVPMGGAAPSLALHWSIWLLLAVALALVGMVVWRAMKSRRKKAPKPATGPKVPIRLDEEGLSADRLPEAGWLEMGEKAMADGDFRLALRAFYLASLAWLGRNEFLTIHAGKTNREFEADLRHRARTFPQARALFAANVRAYERAWYGLHEVSEEDLAEFRRRSEAVKTDLAPALARPAGEAAA